MSKRLPSVYGTKSEINVPVAPLSLADRNTIRRKYRQVRVFDTIREMLKVEIGSRRLPTAPAVDLGWTHSVCFRFNSAPHMRGLMRRRIRDAGPPRNPDHGTIAMDAQQFLAELDELFELDPGTLTPTDIIQDISGWSSLTFMGLIALVDEECGVTLSPDTVLGCESIADLMQEVGLTADVPTVKAA